MNIKHSFAVLTAALGIGGISGCDDVERSNEVQKPKDVAVYHQGEFVELDVLNFDIQQFLSVNDDSIDKCKDKTAEIAYLNSQNNSRKILSLWLGDYLNDDYKLALMAKDHHETYKDRLAYYDALFSCEGGDKDLSVKAQKLLDKSGNEDEFIDVVNGVLQNHGDDAKAMFDKEHLMDRAEAFFVFYMEKVEEELGANAVSLTFDEIKHDLSKSIDLNYGQLVGGELIRDLMGVFDMTFEQDMTLVEDVVEKLCFYYLADKILEQQKRQKEQHDYNRKHGILEASVGDPLESHDLA
ncbi:MAG: hypothetical protein ACRBDI_09555 [Alphaproteobacteria bacterium]